MYKQDLALNNLKELVCHKTQPKKQPIIPKSEGLLLFFNVC